jgi:hypothetical protein
MDLFLAGTETSGLMAAALAASEMKGTKPRATVLNSYFSMHSDRTGGFDEMWDLVRGYGRAAVVTDSGLFTMMFGAGKGKTYDLADLKAYAAAYLTYMKAHAPEAVVVEMDVHKVLGLAALAELRKLCGSMWPDERCIYVWHIEEGEDGLRALVDRYPYVALSVPEFRIIARTTGKPLTSLLLSALRTIRREPKGGTVRVHLLGCTQRGLMLNPHYDSVDSTSWISGVRWGGWTRLAGTDFGKVQKLPMHADTYSSVSAVADMQREAAAYYRAFCQRHRLTKALATLDNPGNKYEVYFANNMIVAAEYLDMERVINDQYFAAPATARAPYDPWRGQVP